MGKVWFGFLQVGGTFGEVSKLNGERILQVCRETGP
jgi:hypothetical protein